MWTVTSPIGLRRPGRAGRGGGGAGVADGFRVKVIAAVTGPLIRNVPPRGSAAARRRDSLTF